MIGPFTFDVRQLLLLRTEGWSLIVFCGGMVRGYGNDDGFGLYTKSQALALDMSAGNTGFLGQVGGPTPSRTLSNFLLSLCLHLKAKTSRRTPHQKFWGKPGTEN